MWWRDRILGQRTRIHHHFQEDGTVKIVEEEVPLKKRLMQAAPFASVWGATLATMVVTGGGFVLSQAWNDYQADRESTRGSLQRIERYMSEAQERGRSFAATLQRHETDLDGVKMQIIMQGNRITAIEAVRAIEDRRNAR